MCLSSFSFPPCVCLLVFADGAHCVKCNGPADFFLWEATKGNDELDFDCLMPGPFPFLLNVVFWAAEMLPAEHADWTKRLVAAALQTPSISPRATWTKGAGRSYWAGEKQLKQEGTLPSRPGPANCPADPAFATMGPVADSDAAPLLARGPPAPQRCARTVLRPQS
jgi:hypothetical protein